MPVIIPKELPATQKLIDQNIFVMNEGRAHTQDIRPLKICILNLMPDKITTETQLLQKLSNSIIHIDVTLLTMESHKSKNTPEEHLVSFYKHFSDIKDQKFDAIVVTGAPIEHLEFQQVTYWNEITEILDWCETNVFCSLFICWATQAATYHYFDMPKKLYPDKLSGVFPHIKEEKTNPLLLGMDDIFYVPHSRFAYNDDKDIRANKNLKVIASSKEAGIHLFSTLDNRKIFMTGHPEYDTETLYNEYKRDLRSDKLVIPKNYFMDDDPSKPIITRWKSSASLFYLNWLNYFVYQETDYDFLEK